MVVWKKHHCGHRELHEEDVGLVGKARQGQEAEIYDKRSGAASSEI